MFRLIRVINTGVDRKIGAKFMTNESKNKMQVQFTKEQIEATPKEILEILFIYLKEEINSTKREIMFLETTISRIKGKNLPEMEEKLKTMTNNKVAKTDIQQQKRLINEYIDAHNESIESYHEMKEYLNILEKNALTIVGVLKYSLHQ